MIGRYDETHANPRTYRDMAEYVSMRMVLDVVQGMRQNNNGSMSVDDIRKLRDNWTRDGEVIDFSRHKARPSDFVNLLRATGQTDLGVLGSVNDENLADTLKDKWKEYRDVYKESEKNGVFLHSIADPELRDTVYASADAFRRPIVASKGASLRDLNPGDNFTILDRQGVNPIASGAYQAPTAQVSEAEAESDSAAEAFVDSEQLLGWEGGTVDGREYRGLKDIVGAYLTKADGDIVAKNFDGSKMVDAKHAYRTLDLLEHLRSNGYDFNVKENARENRIDLGLNVGENVTVRAFDADDDGKYIGRVYDKYNTYHMDHRGVRGTAPEFDGQDAIRIIDYVAGKPQGRLIKAASTDSSRVEVEGTKKHIFISPSTKENDIYRALKFTSEQEAQEFIETGINEARQYASQAFNKEALQALYDKGLDDENILVTSAEFQLELESVYSKDPVIRQAQEYATEYMKHSDDKGLEFLSEVEAGIVGDYENGFNPSFVLDHMQESDRGNNRDALIAAMKYLDYDIDKVKGNDFAVSALTERLVKFDPETAKSKDDVEHPMQKLALEVVEQHLKDSKLYGKDGFSSVPKAMIDEQGVIKWEATRRTGSKVEGKKLESISGEIGQVMVPDEHGIVRTNFKGGDNHGFVPGYTGYFSFEGDYDDRMSRFRVKGFEQHLTEQLKSTLTHQVTRPYDENLDTGIPTALDASALNGLYHGDVYGKRIDLDFMDVNQLDMTDKQAILETLSNRVRFDNQFSDHATTSAETQANREYGQNNDSGAFSYYKAAGETNMRVLGADIENYADLTMTGTGKTQGLIWYLADGAKVNPDGTVTPSEGMEVDGEIVPDKTALKKLPYFDQEAFNAWDRTQMSANQLMTALKVDKGAKTALMTFGGWTFDDSYVVSKEFAERNQVRGKYPTDASMSKLDETLDYMRRYPDTEGFSKHDILKDSGMMWSDDVIKEGIALQEDTLNPDQTRRAEARAEYAAFLEEHGTFRPLQRGDKLSDFGGNKGTIGIVIDRDMSPDVAKNQKLEKEVAFMKANPELDVISAPYSMLSRHNAGVVKELMSGETQDLVDPFTGETHEAVIGELDIIVTDMVVDKKTQAYSREDVLDGKGRKASGQLAWALQAKGADGIMNEVYGRNDSAWSTYREYLITTGLDMKPDGTIVEGYQPHFEEERQHVAYDPEKSSEDFLNEITDQGGIMDLPFEVEFKTGQATNELPIMSAALRQDVELIDGSMRRSDFNNQYTKIYEAVDGYSKAESEEDKALAQQKAQYAFDQIQSTIIDRQFDGGHNGKHSFLRDKIMGKRMQNSATAVAMVDPRLNIGEAGMNQEMMDALNAKEGDTVMMFRDPVWRDGAIRAMTVKHDETAHGVAFNPISDKSHDGDFDGDTYGIIKFESEAANRDLRNKFSHEANMLDLGPGEVKHDIKDKDGNVIDTEYKAPLYFQTGMDLASSEAVAREQGNLKGIEAYEKADKLARSGDPRQHKQALKALNTYTHEMFRNHGFATEMVKLKDDEAVFGSFRQMVERGAKGNMHKAYPEYVAYHNGEKTAEDAREIQYATGVKSDDTGLAGAFSQKLVSVMRNDNTAAALESMYPLTQGTLQIKKDAQHARTVNEILTEDMNAIFRAKNLKEPMSKDPVMPKVFKEQLADTLNNKMGVDVADAHLQAVTDTLTVNGTIVPLKEAMAVKGAPMDRVAYGGGYDELKRLAKQEVSLLQGSKSQQFAPFSMRYADEQTKIAKKDTQRVIEQQAEAEVTATKTAEREAVAVSQGASQDYGPDL